MVSLHVEEQEEEGERGEEGVAREREWVVGVVWCVVGLGLGLGVGGGRGGGLGCLEGCVNIDSFSQLSHKVFFSFLFFSSSIPLHFFLTTV